MAGLACRQTAGMACQGHRQWELSRGSISEAVIKLKGDTPFPPTLLSYKAGVILWLDKAVGGTV